MQRVILIILFSFWAFMSYRLWQVEYAGQSLGAAVDIRMVWKKMLSSQDKAQLQIVDERSGQLLGALEWEPMVVSDASRSIQVEGMVEKVREYSLDISRGRIYASDPREDVIYDFHLNLSPFPDHHWTNIQLSFEREFNEINYEFDIDAASTNNFLGLSVSIGELKEKVEIPFSDLKEPAKLVGTALKIAGVPDLAANGITLMIKNLLSSKDLQMRSLTFEINLPPQANIDLLPGVRSRIKVYRIDIPVVDDMLVKVYVNTLGEILRVEIPEILIGTISKAAKLDLPKSIVLRNQNFYGKLRRKP